MSVDSLALSATTDPGPISMASAPDDLPSFPPNVGRRVLLRPITPADYDFIYDLETSPHTSYRWRHQGQTPSPDAVVESLWAGTLAQFLIVRRETGEPVGFVNAHNADLANGFCYIAMVGHPKFERTALVMDGMALFLNYLFSTWPFRVLYGESLEFNLRNFRLASDRLFRVEGQLRNHRYFDGRYWDKWILAVHRDDWELHKPRLLRVVLPRAGADERETNG